jgi:hypothetical protein
MAVWKQNAKGMNMQDRLTFDKDLNVCPLFTDEQGSVQFMDMASGAVVNPELVLQALAVGVLTVEMEGRAEVIYAKDKYENTVPVSVKRMFHSYSLVMSKKSLKALKDM